MPSIVRLVHCAGCHLPHSEDGPYHETPDACHKALEKATTDADTYWIARIDKQKKEAAIELAKLDKRRSQLLTVLSK
jgi:hypothetical protein